MGIVKDPDLSLWLHNKLGQLEEHWTSKTVSPHLDLNLITNACTLFHDFQPQVKIKFLLSLLHITKRNLEEWKAEVQNFIDIAENSSDQWCCALSKILKNYTKCGMVSFHPDLFEEYLPTLFKQIAKLVEDKKSNFNLTPSLLPLECLYLNKNALQTLTMFQPTQTKYFALKRKPKSAILRAEMLQKAHDATVQAKSKNPMGALIPMKSKTAIKTDMQLDITTLIDPTAKVKSTLTHSKSSKSVANKQMLSQSFQQQPTNPMLGNLASKLKEGAGKIKLLDISEQPLTGKDAKKRRRQPEELSLFASQPLSFPIQTESSTARNVAHDFNIPDDSPLVDRSSFNNPYNISGAFTTPQLEMPSHNANLSQLNFGNPNTQQTGQINHNFSTFSNMNINTNDVYEDQSDQYNSIKTERLEEPSMQNNFNPPSISQNLDSELETPYSLSDVLNNPSLIKLTGEQVMQAQEIFKDTNVVTQPEKTLILAFMSGIRENPCPAQGNLLSIKLNERLEEVALNDSDPNHQLGQTNMTTLIAQIFFQMNYETGEWKMIKTFRAPGPTATNDV